VAISNKLNSIGLNNYNYFIRTRDKQNPYLSITDLNDIVGLGVSSFKINGSEYLLQGSEIRFELIDSDGNQLPISGVTNLVKGTSRVVSFQLSDNVPNGTVRLYIAATLDKFVEGGIEENIPPRYEGIENFLFEYNLILDKSRTNSDEIIFRKQPTLEITPLLRVVRNVSKSSETTSTLTGVVGEYRYIPELFSYEVFIDSAPDTYNVSMNGGTITISNGLGLTLEGIVEVYDDSTIVALLKNPDIETFTVNEFRGILGYDERAEIEFTISYTTIPNIGENKVQEKAIASIRIKDMGVVSGDV